MEKIKLRAYAKINLGLDVLGLTENGYHQVSMVMQQLKLHDSVDIFCSPSAQNTIRLEVEGAALPLNRENLAYRAAELMLDKTEEKWDIKISIEKRIPVAAGLAGGSSNAAAVILGLNKLMEMDCSLEELMKIGTGLGSDIPFCIMGQAKGNLALGERICGSSLAATCARAEGIGEVLTPLKPLKAHVILSKPPIEVLTKDVYRGIDELWGNDYKKKAYFVDIDKICEGLSQKDYKKVVQSGRNVLELFSLKHYPIIEQTKEKMQLNGKSDAILMSGSGPTVFALYEDGLVAKRDFGIFRNINRETIVTETLV